MLRALSQTQQGNQYPVMEKSPEVPDSVQRTSWNPKACSQNWGGGNPDHFTEVSATEDQPGTWASFVERIKGSFGLIENLQNK